MTDPARLFRAEALRSRTEDLRHDDPAGPGPLAQVSPRWTTWAYWALLALAVAGLSGSAQARVGEFARGPAVVRGRTVVAVLPAVFASRLRPGLPLTLTLPGRTPVTVAVTATGPELTGARAASTLLDTDVPPAGLPPGTLLAVRAAAAETTGQQAGTEQPGTEQPGTEQPGTEQPGTASVQVGSQRLIVTFVTGLAPRSGAGDG